MSIFYTDIICSMSKLLFCKIFCGTISCISSFQQPESWSLDDEGRIEQAQLYKEKGTKYFKSGNMKLAVKMYKTMLDFLDNGMNMWVNICLNFNF